MAYSILSLDGGGSWALIQVKILQQRYGATALGHDILKKYDLVIANSGGSIVLAALCVNKSLDEIEALFLSQEILETIFVRNFTARLIENSEMLNDHDILPRFKTAEKIKGLKAQLGKNSKTLMTDLPALIGKVDLQIIITGFDYDRERAVYFRSNKNSKLETCNIMKAVGGASNEEFKTTTLLDAVHASTNAPVEFFDDPAELKHVFPDEPDRKSAKRRFWDGAVGGNNNPVVAGIIEAIANGAIKSEIRVVSIGTGSTVLPVLYGDKGESHPDQDWLVKIGKNEGTFQDIKKISTAIISDPPDSATFLAHQILELPFQPTDPRLIRINPLLKPILTQIGVTDKYQWEKPGIGWLNNKLEHLFNMDMAVTHSDDMELINRMTEEYFDGHFENQGIRIGGKYLDAILGHKKFGDALNDWNTWQP